MLMLIYPQLSLTNEYDIVRDVKKINLIMVHGILLQYFLKVGLMFRLFFNA